ncbi:MAG TPA: O-antigen ligase family protein [Fimbriiglobus sp.]
MKQTIFMVVLTASACLGSFVIRPFIGLAVYILYAVLRPQFLWKWSLEWGVSWSFYVAIATIAALVITGSRPPSSAPGRCPPGRFKFSWSHGFFYAFGLAIILSYIFARDRQAAEQHMDEYSKLYVMYTVGMICIRTVGQVWAIFLIYTLSLAYISYEINFQYLVNGYLGIAKQGYGGHDNNGAGMLLAMGVPLCAFAWEYYRRWYRWAFAILIPVIIHAVLLTYSRGAMLSLIVASPFWVLRGKYRKQKFLLGCLVAATIPFLAGKEIADRFFSISKMDTDGSAQSRFTSWSIGLQIASEYPVFGIGVRNSPLVTFDYGADEPGRVIHNQYIQIAADCGFVGAACYLGIVGLAFWNFRKVAQLARPYDDIDSRRTYLAACGLQSSLVTFCTGAFFLSCEAFEPQYYLFLCAAMLRSIYEGGVKQAQSAVGPRVVSATVSVPVGPGIRMPNRGAAGV